jgi:hypothetical protein
MEVNLGPAKGKDFVSTLGPVSGHRRRARAVRRQRAFPGAGYAGCGERHRDLTGPPFHCEWPFEDLISYASRGTWVRPGDVLGSGSCGNGGSSRSSGTARPVRPSPVAAGTCRRDVVEMSSRCRRDVMEMSVEGNRHDPQQSRGGPCGYGQLGGQHRTNPAEDKRIGVYCPSSCPRRKRGRSSEAVRHPRGITVSTRST